MSRRFLRSMIVGATLLLLLLMTAVPSGAAAPRSPAGHSPLPVATPQHSNAHIVPNPSLVIGDKKGPHYLFAEDGTSPDSIDVYKIGKTGLTHVGNYPNNANNYHEVYVGTQKLGISTKDKAHGNCLLLVDSNNFSPPGFVDSFTINADGSLSSEVSHLQVAGGGDPSEVHITGDTAYVASPGNDFESYSVGAGCTLTFLSKTAQHGNNLNFALVGSKEIVAPDFSGSAIDVYTLGAGGSITFLASTPSQVSSPDGAAVETAKTKSGSVTNVFTGAFTNPTAAEAGQLNKLTGAVTFFTGSPAPDSSGVFGVFELVDKADGLLIQGQFSSSSLGVYKITTGTPGKPGSISFLQHASLVSGDAPQDLAQLGKMLFANGAFNGDIEACTLSKTGATGCASVAHMTSSATLASGLVIL